MSNQLAVVNSQLGVYDRMSNPIEAVEKLGGWIAKSGMFGCTKEEQGMVFALQCMSERKAPLEMAKQYHVIGGKLSMRSDAMLAGFRERGGKVQWKQYDDKAAVARWIYDGNDVELSYTIEQAKNAGLVKSDSGWTKHPAAMLRARLISTAIRMLAPEVCTGVYTPEEVSDFEPAKEKQVQGTVIESTPVLANDDLEVLLESYEPHATELFLEKGWVTGQQTYLDCEQEKRKSILKNPKPLLEILNERIKNAKENKE